MKNNMQESSNLIDRVLFGKGHTAINQDDYLKSCAPRLERLVATVRPGLNEK